MISKWKEWVQVCLDEKPDVALVAGDLFPKDCDILGQAFFMKHLRKYAKKIKDAGIEFVLIMGNDDNQLLIPEMDQAEKDGLWHHIHEKVVTLYDHEFVGVPWVPDYPFGYKFWCRKEHVGVTEYCYHQYGKGVEIGDDNEYHTIPNLYDYFENKPSIEDSFARLIPKVKKMSSSIWLIHAPPAGYRLDMCGSGECVGSMAVKEFIEKHQPMLTIHGHIHESPACSGVWKVKIGDSMSIQNGQLGLKLHYNVIHIQDENIVDVQKFPK